LFTERVLKVNVTRVDCGTSILLDCT